MTCKRCQRQMGDHEFYPRPGMPDRKMSVCRRCLRQRIAKNRLEQRIKEMSRVFHLGA